METLKGLILSGALAARKDQAFERLHVGRRLVSPAQFPVIPGDAVALDELQRDPLGRLPAEAVARALAAAHVAVDELHGEVGNGLDVAVDLHVAAQHHAAQLGVLDPGLDLQRRARVALEVADLLRLRIGPRPDPAAPQHVPERHQVGEAVAPVRGAGDGLLLPEEGLHLLRGHLDLVAAAHGAATSSRSAARSTASRASAGSRTAASPASLSTSLTR